ncbi:MAG: tetratricopeptide repeat protein [Chloroflexi bacterium]|nr:tetratricopeptide repeat protein [Chloroflexota bacterium]
MIKTGILKTIIILAVSALIFSGCSFIKKENSSTSPAGNIAAPGGDYQSTMQEAMNYQSSGDNEKALMLANKAERISPGYNDPERDLLLARLYLETGQPDKAEYYVNLLLEKKPRDLTALDLKLSLMENLKNYNETEKLANQILAETNVPGNIKVNAFRGLGYVSHYRDNEYKKADEYYKKAQEISPGDPLVLFGLADVAAVRRKFHDLAKYLKEIEKNKDKLDRDNLLMLHRWLGDSHVFFGRNDEAQKEYLKALEIDPGDHDSSIRLAYVYLYDHDLENSQKYLGDTPFKDPGDIEASIVAYRLWRSEGRYYRALKSLEDAKKRAGKDDFEADLWWVLGNVYRMLGRYEEGEKIYREYARRQPDAVQANLGIAACLLGQGKEAEANKLFEKWTAVRQKIQPQDVYEIYFMKAEVYLKRLNNMKKAEENMKLFMELAKPDNFEPPMMMGYLKLVQGKVDEAEKLFERSIKLAHHDYYPRLEIAGMCAGTGHKDLADKYIRSAQGSIAKLSPPVKAALYYRCAMTYYGMGDILNAISFAERAKVTDPRLTENLVLLCRLYREMGKNQKAERFLDDALKLEPEFEQAVFEKEHPGKVNPYFVVPE